MTTIAIGINKSNLQTLASFIHDSVNKIVDFREYAKFWQVTSLSENVKNEFIFDKKDFLSPTEILNAFALAAKAC